MDPMHAASTSTNLAPRKRTGWQRGRILTTRIVALLACGAIFVASHPTKMHGMKDLVMAGLGLYLVLAAIKGRIWCMLYIGGRKNESLVTEGPYARCRNPLYFYSAMGVAGISMATGMVSVVLATLIIFMVAYHFVIQGEESRLRSLHGERYRRYCQSVPRFWPRRDVPNDSALREFAPKLFHKAFWDSVGFLMGWLTVTGAHLLHMRDSLPKWVELL